ncbi:MAG: hypothetical protein J6U54_01925 [Clostridiales bacterium]|nr:hypothetical protein [Clostridiales bacterium]
MNKMRRFVSAALIVTSVFLTCSCSAEAVRRRGFDKAGKECDKVASEYFEALSEDDYDKAAELSLFKEDYSDLPDFSELEYLEMDGLVNSSDSYNGYYGSCRFRMNGEEKSCLIYFSYSKAEREWKINAINYESMTATKALEDLFYPENN